MESPELSDELIRQNIRAAYSRLVMIVDDLPTIGSDDVVISIEAIELAATQIDVLTNLLDSPRNPQAAPRYAIAIGVKESARVQVSAVLESAGYVTLFADNEEHAGRLVREKGIRSPVHLHIDLDESQMN